MANIFNTATLLVKFLNETTVDKFNKSVDSFVERFNEPNQFKPIEGDGFFLPHSKSPTYVNGRYHTDYIDGSILTAEQQQEAQGLTAIKNTYDEETMYILRWIRSVTMQLCLNGIEDPDKLHQVLFDILPDFILQDKQLLLKCKLSEKEVDLYQNHKVKYGSLFTSDKQKEEFFLSYKDSRAEEFLQKYYALSLLTDY